METISTTGVPQKNKGDGLSSADINSINGTVNECVMAINPMLKNLFNINAENNNFSNIYTLGETVNAVPLSRRCLGLMVRFKSDLGYFLEYSYAGDDLSDTNWNNTDNWISYRRHIDGGEW